MTAFRSSRRKGDLDCVCRNSTLYRRNENGSITGSIWSILYQQDGQLSFDEESGKRGTGIEVYNIFYNQYSNKYYYLMGNEMNAEYLCNGVEDYTSICGHRNTVNYKIWKNEKGNLIMCDGYENGFGDEVINMIVQEMENHKDNVIVIFAGYPKPMQQFLDRNPGMRSRIAFCVEFDDYSVEELCEITKLMLSRKQMTITEAGMKKLKKNFESIKDSRDYGNGRFARKMLEEAEMNLAERICQMDETEITTEVLTTIEESDIPDVPLEERRKIRKIGFAC